MSALYTEAESRMTALELKITDLEALCGSDTTKIETVTSSETLIDYQTQMLRRLVTIRDAIIADGGDHSLISAERDHFQAENVKLRKEAEKLNYRVQHLVKALNQAEASK